MPRLDPYVQFFGNSVDAGMRLGDLQRFLEEADGFLEREETYFREETHQDVEREFLPLFAETFPPILHSSIIIATAILLEQEMRGFSNALIDALDSKLKFGDLSGSVLERFRTVVTKVADLPLDDRACRWNDLLGLFEIRNCLVHASGELSEFGRAPVIRAFAAKHGTPVCGEWHMTVDAATSGLALAIASDFLDSIYPMALARFPQPQKP